MTTEIDLYLAEINNEIHPSFKNRIKNVLRPLYGTYKRRRYRKRIDQFLEIPKEWQSSDYFIDEGHYTNADLIRNANGTNLLQISYLVVAPDLHFQGAVELVTKGDSYEITVGKQAFSFLLDSK